MDLHATPDPLTTAEGVAEFVVLAELSTALSERLGGWSTDGADPDSSATMASLAARLDEHSTWWTGRIPESVLIEGERTAASGSGQLAEVFGILDVAASDRRAAVEPVLDRLVAYLVALAERLSPLGDAPALRTIRLVLADLEDRPR
jgi:hypothetical protein